MGEGLHVSSPSHLSPGGRPAADVSTNLPRPKGGPTRAKNVAPAGVLPPSQLAAPAQLRFLIIPPPPAALVILHSRSALLPAQTRSGVPGTPLRPWSQVRQASPPATSHL